MSCKSHTEGVAHFLCYFMSSAKRARRSEVINLALLSSLQKASYQVCALLFVSFSLLGQSSLPGP
jgi:hypothetical protein